MDDRWRDMLAHRDRLLRLASARCATREDAEDAVQEAMLRCATFAGLDPARLAPLLTSVTVRLCVDAYRERDRAERARERLDAPVAEDPGEIVCRATELSRIEVQLRRLPMSQRGVLVDRARGLTLPQIARRRGLTYKAAESALFRARMTLRAALPLVSP